MINTVNLTGAILLYERDDCFVIYQLLGKDQSGSYLMKLSCYIGKNPLHRPEVIRPVSRSLLNSSKLFGFEPLVKELFS
jgi:hypothetical protein